MSTCHKNSNNKIQVDQFNETFSLIYWIEPVCHAKSKLSSSLLQTKLLISDKIFRWRAKPNANADSRGSVDKRSRSKSHFPSTKTHWRIPRLDLFRRCDTIHGAKTVNRSMKLTWYITGVSVPKLVRIKFVWIANR